MAGTFAAELPAASKQFFQHVAVTDLGAHEGHAELPQRDFDRHVGHQRADGAGHRQPLRETVDDHQVKQLVAVVQAARLVDELQPIGVAVQRDTVVGAVRRHRRDQCGRRCCAETGVDVRAVRAAADRDDLGAELVEHVGRNVIRRAVGCVDDDLQPLQRKFAAERALAEFDVAAAGVVDALGPAQVGRIDPLRRLL